jgi:hypothetical protein
VSVQIPVQIVGSTVTVTAGTSSLSAPPAATATTLTITLKDAGNNAVSGATVNLTQTGAGSVTFGSTSGTTNSSGVWTTTATGAASGALTVIASALGTTGTIPLTVTASGPAFSITAPASDPAAMTLTDSLTVTVYVPAPITSVTFATTIGQWDGGGTKVVTKTGLIPPTTVSAILTTSLIGLANVQVYDTAHPTVNDTLTVAMTSGAAAAKIFLQATPTVLPLSIGTTTGSATLTATVTDASNNPLGGQPVAFQIVDGTSTSGGETLSPVVVMTTSTGQASTNFSSGSMPSAGTGVKIRASVVASPVTVHTGSGATPPSIGSGNDAAIVIGGLAGSIAFGQATAVGTDSTTANYTWKMSILVSDSNGNAVPGAVVNLGVWPIAWSTGQACSFDADCIWDITHTVCTKGNYGTFWNEDQNENLILDAGEDGWRHYYADPLKILASPVAGTIDGLITPTNSAGGSVKSNNSLDAIGTVTTDSNGVAGFTLTYPKQSAIWTIDRIRATTIVQGTETRGQIILRLPALAADVNPCYLGDSPYTF